MGSTSTLDDAPLVSVIVPTFNDDPELLCETIESVLAQSFKNLELIVVDDRSTRSPKNLLRSFQDERLRPIYRDENGGGAAARNTGTKAARGRYIAYLDSDDLWHPDKLQTQLDFMQTNGSSFTYTYYDIIDENGKPYAHSGPIPTSATYDKLLPFCYIRTSSIMYDRQKTKRRLAFPALRRRQDFGLFLRILKRVPLAELVPQTLCSYRVRPDSLSAQKFGNIRYQWMIYRHVEQLGLLRSASLIGQWFARAGITHLKRKAGKRRASA